MNCMHSLLQMISMLTVSSPALVELYAGFLLSCRLASSKSEMQFHLSYSVSLNSVLLLSSQGLYHLSWSEKKLSVLRYIMSSIRRYYPVNFANSLHRVSYKMAFVTINLMTCIYLSILSDCFRIYSVISLTFSFLCP